MNRRDLIQRVVLGTTALIVIPSAFTSCTKDAAPDPLPGNNPAPGGGTGGSKITLDLSLPENVVLNTAGGSKVVQTLLVFNTGSTFMALSSICTHQSCTVDYVNSADNIQCGCHGSKFSKSGGVINGPATASLASYQVSKTNNILTITL